MNFWLLFLPLALLCFPRRTTALRGFKSVSQHGIGKNETSEDAGVHCEYLSQDVSQALYEDMVRGRRFEDKVAELYYRGQVAGFVHLYNGQEAVSTGTIGLLRPDDFVVSTYRDHVHAISKGVPMKEVLAELQGRSTGCSKGRGGSMHIFSKKHNFVGGFAFVGEQLPVALGLAYSISYRRSLAKRKSSILAGQHDQVVVAFTGDGSTNMGQFYEVLNVAALAKLPLVIVVENNNWAIGMAAYRSTTIPEIYKRGAAFGVPAVEVDGMDVLAVRAAVADAIERARSELGPSLIEAITYRFRGHSVADPDELRAPVEKSSLTARDPIKLFADNVMLPCQFSNSLLLELTRQRIDAEVAEAVEFCKASPFPGVEEVAEGIYAPSYEVPEGGLDSLTAEEIEEYAKALSAEVEFQKLSKAERKKVLPIQFSTQPLKVID